MKLHILAIAAHPDDIELSCAGTLIKHAQKGQAVGVLDLTQGELGTRGTAAIRLQESASAAQMMGLTVRENVKLPDGFFRNDEDSQRKLIAYIRHFQPEIVIANSLNDRHPDHSRGGRLIADACFYAGLRKINTGWEGTAQEPWRPKRVFHMMQDRAFEPTFIVDISAVYEEKMDAIHCYGSQFFQPGSDEPATYISTPDFLNQIRYKDAFMGKRIGVAFGEAFYSENVPGFADLDHYLLPEVP